MPFPMGKEAVAAAAIGIRLPVFPCRLDKRPACPHGFKDAAISATAIRELWRRWPGPLIGVPTGQASGLFVLDIDPDGIDWLDMACRDGRFTPTQVHRTRRGGFHLVYRLPKVPLSNSAGKLARGIDTRGEGGYVIWPPSGGYEVIDASPPAALPRWLERRLRRPREPEPGTRVTVRIGGAGEVGRAPARSDGLLRFVARSHEGERNTRLFWAACRAAERGDRQLGAQLIAAACGAGLGEFEARRTVASAFARIGGPT
ncbi:MAG TPA: bifunctional DNA primase/polymerase [Stellaceae bacterium]|nr:bifunctional DNA primase/polymerase [Stellaceae bacterium]